MQLEQYQETIEDFTVVINTGMAENRAYTMRADVVSVLLDAGADVNAVTKTGKSALDVAVTWEDGPVLEVLLRQTGINVNLADSGGNTALMTAAKAGKLTALKMLLAAGAEASVKNQCGQTVLALARACNRTEAAEMLASAGAEE